jgi:quinol monooxygenase YgiN
MLRHAVIVTFTFMDARARDLFLPLVRHNAGKSLEQEAGCLCFDVVRGADGCVVLYEIYDDASSFAAHLETAHFREFDEATRLLVQSKSVVRGDVEEHPRR